jgi:hypothetical protein
MLKKKLNFFGKNNSEDRMNFENIDFESDKTFIVAKAPQKY